ncbi:MAG TPA: hypothetical protein VLI04_16245 [Nocardioidaceae bacterium]|nr:hypothetical protein [Nocardioidaceae bacterium]
MNRHAFVVGISLVVGLAGCGGGAESAPPPAETTTTSTLPPTSEEAVPIEPGTYTMPIDGWSVTEYTITVPEGWTLQYGHDFMKHPDSPGSVNFKGVVVDEIYDDACHGEGVPVTVGPGTEALVAALQQQPGPKTSTPVLTTLGDHPATRIDLRVPKGMTPDCRHFGDALQVWYSEAADDYFVLGPDYIVSVYVLDVDGQRQVFLAGHTAAADGEDLAELQSVLDSIRIL